MKALDRLLKVLPSGYGHWKVTIKYNGKERTFTTTNSMAIDNYRSDYDSRRRIIGAATLCREGLRRFYKD